jgi:hypothetical protein
MTARPQDIRHEGSPRAGNLASGAARLLTVVATLLLATIGSFMIGFGMMTDCTNNYSCDTTGCAPCEATTRWLNAGWVAQAVLFAASVALLFPVMRRYRWSTVTGAALAILTASVATFVGTTWAADRSYCQPGDTTRSANGPPNYCRTR